MTRLIDQKCVVCGKTYREHSPAHGDECVRDYWNSSRVPHPSKCVMTRQGIYLDMSGQGRKP